MKVSKNFSLQEFIDPTTFHRFGAKSIWFIDKDIIKLAQVFRDHFGVSITINNWTINGQYKYSGFRPPNAAIGASMSQHRFGRAIDMKFDGLTPKEVFDEVMKNEKKFMDAGLTVLENTDYTPTWLHADIRTTNSDKILIVNP